MAMDMLQTIMCSLKYLSHVYPLLMQDRIRIKVMALLCGQCTKTSDVLDNILIMMLGCLRRICAV